MTETVPSRSARLRTAVVSTTTALAVLPAIPAVFNAFSWIGARWYPIQDFATLDVRMRSLFSGSTPLVGAFSRYGWSHPGPIWYWMLAPLFELTGRQPWSLVVGGSLVTILALIAGSLVARSIAGAIGQAIFALWVAARVPVAGTVATSDPWNPHLALAVLFFVLTAAIGVAVGKSRLAIPLLLGMSVLVQLHVAYALIGAPVIIWAVAIGWRRRDTPWRELVRSWAVRVASVVVVAMWVPPLVDQIIHKPGNLHAMASFFLKGGTGPAHDSVGLTFAVKAFGAGFRPPTSLLGGTNESVPFSDWLHPRGGISLAVMLVVLLVPLTVTRRKGVPTALRRLTEAAAVVGLAVVIAASRVTGERWPYLFDWRFVGSALGWASAATTAVWFLSRHQTRTLLRVAVGTVAVFSLFVGVAEIVGLTRRAHHLIPGEHDARVLADAALRRTPANGYVVARDFGGNILGYSDALIDDAAQHDKPVKAIAGLAYKYGSAATAPMGEARAVWLVAETGVISSVLDAQPGAIIIAHRSPLSAREERAVTAAQQRVIGAIVAANRPSLLLALNSNLVGFALQGVPGISPKDLGVIASAAAKVQRSNECRCSIVEFSPAQAPRSLDAALSTFSRATPPARTPGSG